MRSLRRIAIVILAGLAAPLLTTSRRPIAAAQASAATAQSEAATADNAEGQKQASEGKKSAESGKPASGIPLNTDLTVQANVTAQAVLIPRKIAKAVFGGKIANEYAIIQLTINNKSSDAALIVQGVYIDYSQWALAGGGFSNQPCIEQDSTDPKSKFADCTKPTEVASEEYRVVRGQALNAQTWTWRNGIVRGLILAGTVATGLTFTATGRAAKGYSQSVAAYNGDLVPGVGTFWPDQTIDQINRISDLGYQTNKVISKQGSDIIVCFFPIDRFLSPGFRKIFLKEPALFFSPYQMLVDPTIHIEKILPKGLFDDATPDQMRAGLPCYLINSIKPGDTSEITQADKDAAESCHGQPPANVTRALVTLGRVSLNTIHVVVDGVMSVNTTTLQAKIEEVTIDKETDSKTWNVAKGSSNMITGTITGSYLTGGTPVIQEAKDDKITQVKIVTDGSNDETLKFSFVLGQTLKPGDHLTFVVEKSTKDSKTAPVESAPYQYPVPSPAAEATSGKQNSK